CFVTRAVLWRAVSEPPASWHPGLKPGVPQLDGVSPYPGSPVGRPLAKPEAASPEAHAPHRDRAGVEALDGEACTVGRVRRGVGVDQREEVVGARVRHAPVLGPRIELE